MKRIGLFGGSFDPVHCGHLLVAQAALEEACLDRLYFLPAAQSPFKPDTPPTPPAQRLRWLRLALAGRTQCEVDDREIRRGGTSYSIETVRQYAAEFPGTELFYLVGADHLPQLPGWRDSAELARLVVFLVVPRPGEPVARVPEPFRVRQLHGFPLAVSSSDIRHRIQAGLAVETLLPPPVAEAIRNEQSYRSRPSP